jgi:GST-like protein
MIDLYYAPTPNGYKIKIFLEESGLEYKTINVNLRNGEQFKPEFLAISPNNKIPAIVDHNPADKKEPLSVFESGAILLYLADKAGKFMPKEFRAREEATQWLFWQAANLTPMASQATYFNNYATEKVPYAIERYEKELTRLYGILDKQLKEKEFIAGEYSIVDMICYPWIVLSESHHQNLDDFPNLKRWFENMAKRPAVKRAYG